MKQETEFVNFPKCYESCGGYCCKGFKNANFKFFDGSYVALPLLEKEFNEYKKSGGIIGLEEAKKIEEFKLKNGAILRIFWLHCSLVGLCNPHQNRPLICKLYPFLPKVDNKGEILDFFSATFFDLFYDKSSHPCTLVAQHEDEVKAQLKNSLEPLLKDPLYIFAFRACELLAVYLRNLLKKEFGSYLINKINDENHAKFWQKAEMLLLLRKAWRNQEFYNEICDIHDEIAQIWGEFLPFK